MKGFIKCSMHSKVISHQGRSSLFPMNRYELIERNNKMANAGFIPDYDMDCYVMEGYGAWMGNVENADGFSDFYQVYIDKGYELVFGPPAPPQIKGYGVFCNNYLEIIEMPKKKAKNFIKK